MIPRPPVYLRARRGGDKMLIFRMCGAAITLAGGIGFLFFHEYIVYLKERAGAPHVGVDGRGIAGLVFSLLLMMIWLGPETRNFTQTLVEGIRAWRRAPPEDR